MIENGDFDKAVQLSKVLNLGEEAAENVESYAAFITVKQRFWTSQLFYWFIPAESEAENKPLIIWLQVWRMWNLISSSLRDRQAQN